MQLKPVPSVPTCSAESYIDSFHASGRTAPILSSCRCEFDDEPHDFVVKLIGNNENREGSAVRELICSLLAHVLNLPTPPAAMIHISKEFIKFSHNTQRAGIKESVGINFGSGFYRGDYREGSAQSTIKSENLYTAAAIFAFDLMVQNMDRRKSKPNLLQKDDYVMIDHELCFSNINENLIGGPPPIACWELERNDRLITDHFFYGNLKGSDGLLEHLKSFCRLVKLISEDTIDTIFSRIPPDWRSDKVESDLPKISDQLCIHSENPDEFLRFLQEVLA